jgi:hypothetical protein
MNDKVDWQYLLLDTRARVYLLWAVLTTGGFTATHYFQQRQINAVWFFISVFGLGYMYRAMPMGVMQMRKIFLAWFVPISFGILVSILAFKIAVLSSLIQYMGSFWLLIMAIGYFLNGLVDAPSTYYWFAAALNIAAAIICYVVEPLLAAQYLVAAIVSGWSMLYLWLFRAS